jgi:tetratricopeptide (TPR) repeat protein
VIERLLAAEKALDAGQLELADRLYAQVAAADPRNAIALTGRATVAQRQGDPEAARRHVTRALEIDPDDAAAMTLSASLAAATASATPAPAPAAATQSMPSTPPAGGGSRFVPPPAAPAPAPRSVGSAIRGFIRRLVGR